MTNVNKEREKAEDLAEVLALEEVDGDEDVKILDPHLLAALQEESNIFLDEIFI